MDHENVTGDASTHSIIRTGFSMEAAEALASLKSGTMSSEVMLELHCISILRKDLHSLFLESELFSTLIQVLYQVATVFGLDGQHDVSSRVLQLIGRSCTIRKHEMTESDGIDDTIFLSRVVLVMLEVCHPSLATMLRLLTDFSASSPVTSTCLMTCQRFIRR
jgi:hypothetical protein